MLQIGKITTKSYPLLMAPMEDISDPPFRSLCKEFGADIVFTEFIASDGLIRDAAKSLQKLDIRDNERPVGIQIFGKDPEAMAEAAKIATSVNPDLIDINFGCPVRKVAMKGAGAGLLNDIPKMVEIAKAVVKSTLLPVTAKTRLGWDDNHKNILDITLRLQDAGISAISIHGRTRTQMYKGKADWSLIGEVKQSKLVTIPIIGNGDVTSGEIAKEMFSKYGVDGIMIGRAAIGKPWIFHEIKHFLETGVTAEPLSIEKRVDICRQHFLSSVEWKGEKLAVFEMRKHYSNYFAGLKGAKRYRNALVNALNHDGVLTLLKGWKQYISANKFSEI